MTFTLLTPKARATAYACAQGTYQDSLLHGSASWAGSDLTGTASRYGRRYHASRETLLARLAAAGLYVERTKGARGRTVVVIMTAAERSRSKDRPAAEVASAAIAKAEKALVAAVSKRMREEARAARELAEDLPTLEMIAHAR